MGVSKLYYMIHPCRTRAQKSTSIGRHMLSTPTEAHNIRPLMFDSMTLHQLRTIVALQTSRIGGSVIPGQDSQEQISSDSCSYRKLCYQNLAKIRNRQCHSHSSNQIQIYSNSNTPSHQQDQHNHMLLKSNLNRTDCNNDHRSKDCLFRYKTKRKLLPNPIKRMSSC